MGNLNKRNFKVAIIGAGPAGIACAIQLKRYSIDFVLFERNQPGGLLLNAHKVANYPGFPEGINGFDLSLRLTQQLKWNKIEPIRENAQDIDYKNNSFRIETDKNKYKSSILVIATGTKAKELPIKTPQDCQSRVFYEIWKMKHIKNKKIVIIGSGDAAFDYALSLSSKNKVLILGRSKEPKCLSLLFRECKKNRKIKYLPSMKISRINFKNKRLILYSVNKMPICIDYLLVAIGRRANLDFLNDNIINKLKTLEHKKKLYMIGDVKNGIFRQTAIAVGDGVRCAMEIYFRLKFDNRGVRKNGTKNMR